jgi:hypothetical protein
VSSMNIDGFIAGIMSALKLSQTDQCPTAHIDEKIVHAFRVLEQLAQRKDIELRFHCSLNPYNKKSATVNYGLVRAGHSGMLKRDGHDIQILLSVEEAADVINDSPLSLAEWKLLTKNLKPELFSVLTEMEQLETVYEHYKA